MTLLSTISQMLEKSSSRYFEVIYVLGYWNCISQTCNILLNFVEQNISEGNNALSKIELCNP